MKARRRGFTIVEMLLVIGIIGILLGIVTTAAAGAVKQARTHKADACCVLVQQGMATYYAQYSKWPGSIGDRIKNGIHSRSNQEGVNNQSDADRYILTGSEIDDMISDMIKEVKKGNPLLDISGLYVSRSSGENGQRNYGQDFMSAIRGTKRNPKKMKVSEMHFGYPETNHGWFRRFRVVYLIPSDEMKVSKQ